MARLPMLTEMVLAVALAFGASAVRAEMIHLFARKGDVEKVLAELAKGVSIDLPSTRNTTEIGVSPLFIAAKFGHSDVVAALIDAGADYETLFEAPDGGDPYGTPMHVAAAWGQTDVVRMLLAAGAEVDAFHRRIGTPLHRALEAGRQDAAEVLLMAGASTRVEVPFDSSEVANADLAVGEKIGIGCGGCHAIEKAPEDPPEIGPNLWGIVGRAKAADAGFAYSPAIVADDGVWSMAALNSFLASPYQYLPGTKMHFAGIEDSTRRAAVIAWLRLLSDDPAPILQ